MPCPTPPPRTAPGRETPGGTATNGSSDDRPTQGGTHGEAARTPDDGEAQQEADRRRRTQHPFNTKDKDTVVLGFVQGGVEPLPNPDKCTVIYEISPLGETTLHPVVPRSRWPRDRGCIEDF